MIVLRPMRNEEYPAYLDYFIPDYAAEISANYALSPAAALAQAQREIDDSDGAEKRVGYLWYKPDEEMRSAFICDFYIYPALQGQGLGKQAMAAFEHALKSQGISQVKLRVAGDNPRARHLYDAAGFRVTGVNMSKNIPTD